MNVEYPQYFFSAPFAHSGDKRILETEAATGRANVPDGFPIETERPLAAGGIAPYRVDFNGLLYQITAMLFWQQSGGMYRYAQTLNYDVPAIVAHNSAFFSCTAPNGPDTERGVVLPGGLDNPCWEQLNFGGVPRGMIAMWSGKISEIPSGWALCDGLDGRPNLIDRFIKGVSRDEDDVLRDPGRAGGAHEIRLTTGNIPEISLTLSNLAHTHSMQNHYHGTGNHSHGFSGTANGAGSHYHGHMWEYGGSGLSTRWGWYSDVQGPGIATKQGWDRDNWAANTSTDGYHSHSVSGSIGSASAGNTYGPSTNTTGAASFSSTPSATAGSAVPTPIDNRPLFYELAYIIKL